MPRATQPDRRFRIPTRAELEALDPGYTADEIEYLAAAREHHDPLTPREREELGRELLRDLWPDERTYIAKQHWIRTKTARQTRLAWNYAQLELFELIAECQQQERPIRIIILKARQLGFSTAIQSWHYEQCDRHPNRVAMTISYDDPSTKELFQKAQLIHRRLWFPRETTRNRDNVVEFAPDHSSLFLTRTAGTSEIRGDTFHHVHMSEMPMWPDAASILDGVMNGVPEAPNTSIIIESTAKGAVGEFYEMWTAATEGRSGFVPFFVPWFWDPEYTYPVIDAAAFRRKLDRDDFAYMERHQLTLEQMAWRFHKTRDSLRGSKLRFRQEFPASAEEAFISSGTPAFNPDAVAALQANVTVPDWTGDIGLLE